MRSAVHFSFANYNYAATRMSFQDPLSGQFAPNDEVWVLGIDPEVRHIALKINEDVIAKRGDVEPFVVGQNSFVSYYTDLFPEVPNEYHVVQLFLPNSLS